MIYLFLSLLFGLIIWLEVPRLVQKKETGLLVAFSVLMAFAIGLSVALVKIGKIPSPTSFLTKLLAPLATKIFGLKI